MMTRFLKNDDNSGLLRVILMVFDYLKFRPIAKPETGGMEVK